MRKLFSIDRPRYTSLTLYILKAVLVEPFEQEYFAEEGNLDEIM
jgi:hypothetical protein